MQPEQKAWIDNATYEEMLAKYRFAPIGDPFFKSGTALGDYFEKVFAKKRNEVGTSGHTAASKSIGWE